MPHACVCVHVSIYLRMLRCKQNEKRSEDKSALIAKLCAKKKREIWKSSKVKGKCDAIHYDKHFTHSPNKLKTKTLQMATKKKQTKNTTDWWLHNNSEKRPQNMKAKQHKLHFYLYSHSIWLTDLTWPWTWPFALRIVNEMAIFRDQRAWCKKGRNKY